MIHTGGKQYIVVAVNATMSVLLCCCGKTCWGKRECVSLDWACMNAEITGNLELNAVLLCKEVYVDYIFGEFGNWIQESGGKMESLNKGDSQGIQA